jgi:hypothetical protein
MRTFKDYLAEKEEQTFIHYSHRDNLTHLYGGMSGSGIKGAEDERVKQSKDSRIKKRIYFYPSVGSDHLPRPEAGLGSHVYHAKLSNLHDASKPSQESNEIAKLAQKRISSGEHPHSAYESSVLDRGHSGYKTDNLAVVLNHDVPVKYVGSSIGKPFKDHVFDTKEKKKSIFGGIPNSSGEHTSSHLTSDQVSFWQQHKPDLQKAAPSAKMQYGQLTVHKDHLENLKTELEKHPNHPL